MPQRGGCWTICGASVSPKSRVSCFLSLPCCCIAFRSNGIIFDRSWFFIFLSSSIIITVIPEIDVGSDIEGECGAVFATA